MERGRYESDKKDRKRGIVRERKVEKEILVVKREPHRDR